MSLAGLVAYGSSDESSSENEEEKNASEQKRPNCDATVSNGRGLDASSDLPESTSATTADRAHNAIANSPVTVQTTLGSQKLQLPKPKSASVNNGTDENDDNDCDSTGKAQGSSRIFEALPKRRQLDVGAIEVASDAPIPKKINYGIIEKPPNRKKGPIKISFPALSDFKDLEEDELKETRKQPSQKGSGLIGLLPPPKSSLSSMKTNALVPQVLTRKTTETKLTIPTTIT